MFCNGETQRQKQLDETCKRLRKNMALMKWFTNSLCYREYAGSIYYTDHYCVNLFWKIGSHLPITLSSGNEGTYLIFLVFHKNIYVFNIYSKKIERIPEKN